MDLHPTRLAGRAAAGQPGGVQVYIFRYFVFFRKRSILLLRFPYHATYKA